MSDDWKRDDFFHQLGGEEPPGQVEEDFDRIGRMREARLGLVLRVIVLVISVAFSLYLVRSSWFDLSYYMSRGEAAVELGDLRDPDFDRSRFEHLPTNRILAFDNDIVTIDNRMTDKYQIYFSPLLRAVVLTEEELPDKSRWQVFQVIPLTEWETSMVSRRLAHPEDLKIAFSGRGRWIRPEDVPKRLLGLVSYFAEQTHLEPGGIGIVFDGDLPEEHWDALLILGVAALLVIITLLIFLVALRKYLKAAKR